MPHQHLARQDSHTSPRLFHSYLALLKMKDEEQSPPFALPPPPSLASKPPPLPLVGRRDFTPPSQRLQRRLCLVASGTTSLPHQFCLLPLPITPLFYPSALVIARPSVRLTQRRCQSASAGDERRKAVGSRERVLLQVGVGILRLGGTLAVDKAGHGRGQRWS